MPHDHRDLNRDLFIFASDPLAGSGLPLWLPDGAAIRDELQRLAKELAHGDGCLDVYAPALGKRSLTTCSPACHSVRTRSCCVRRTAHTMC